MRELSDKEKNILKQLVTLKKEGKLLELQSCKFLKKELTCFALRWQTKPNVQLTIYANPEQEHPKDEVPQTYFDVADFVYFIKELHSNNFIELQTLQSKNLEDNTEDDSLMLYDRDTYDYNRDSDEFWTKKTEAEFMGKKCVMSGIAYIKNKSIVYLDIVHLLNKYANAIIYPLPRLEDFVKNDFKTVEQRRFDKQTCLTWISIAAAFFIGIISPFISNILSDKNTESKETDIEQLKTIDIVESSISPQIDSNVSVVEQCVISTTVLTDTLKKNN